MKRRPSLVFVLFLAMMLGAGCSVKEDRELCPCRVVLDFSMVDTLAVRSAELLLSSDGGFVFRSRLEPPDFREDLSVYAPRGEVALGVWSGAELVDNGGISVPLGEECPPVYFHVAALDASGEHVRDTVFMRKNHCVLDVRLKGMETVGLVVYGNVDGYGSDGKPSVGEFRHEIQTGGGTVDSVVLPRQVDNSLFMEVNDGSGVVRRFAIGEYISAAGYDWDEPDLKDLEMEIDVAFTYVAFRIHGSDAEHRFDVVI